MKKCIPLLALAVFIGAIGCKKEDPRDRPGFVDTSDPSKVMSTMTPVPKSGASTSLGGKGGPPGPPGAGTKPGGK